MDLWLPISVLICAVGILWARKLFPFTSKPWTGPSLNGEEAIIGLGTGAASGRYRYKTISAWIKGRKPRKPLLIGKAYTLNLKVGKPVDSSIVPPSQSRIPDTDIPEDGLETEWVISSRTVELAPIEDALRSEAAEDQDQWTVKFRLHIPKTGESDVLQLLVKPLVRENAGADVLIFSRGKLYRRLTLSFTVSPKWKIFNNTSDVVKKSGEAIDGPATQLHLHTAREYWKPPGNLTISVLRQGGAYIRGTVTSVREVDTQVDWAVATNKIDGRVENLRSAAEVFRARWGDRYLNNVAHEDLERRLTAPFDINVTADVEHQLIWDRDVAVSEELSDLACSGYELYQALFTAGTRLRSWIDSLEQGWRINISWSDITGPLWLPHIPWGLMYTVPPPDKGQPINPVMFFGLRFRLNYTAHDVRNPKSKALGNLAATHQGNCLYWSSQPNDPITQESRWQQKNLMKWPNQVLIPSQSAPLAFGDEIRKILRSPEPVPMPVLYLYCQCEVGGGNNPVLYFGRGDNPTEVVKKNEMGHRPFEDQPLVFINACRSSAASTYRINELEQMFFDRGCRAYLGTETYIPIRLGSCFAAIFYHYFYRDIDPSPIPAGEAVYQTRLFLWRHYRNIGGLLYSYVNQYDLYMATEEELKNLAC